MTYSELTATGLEIEKEVKDLSGATMTSLVSRKTPGIRVLVRNQIHTPDDFFIIGVYTYERATQMLDRWERSK